MAAGCPNPSPVPLKHPFLLTGLGHRISEIEAPGTLSTPTLLHQTDGENEAQKDLDLSKVTQYEQRCDLPASSECPGLPYISLRFRQREREWG